MASASLLAPINERYKLMNMPGLRKRSFSLSGHATSVALEPEFWAVLEAMAGADGLSLAGLIIRIDAARGDRLLASACRVAALERSASVPIPK